MKINKLFWISALVLMISIPIAFAFTWSDLVKNLWFIFFVNSLIIWIVLFIIQRLVLPEKIANEKVIVWILVTALSLVIAYFWFGRVYIWFIVHSYANYFLGWKLVVNALIIAIALYFGLGLLEVDPQKTQGKIGLAIGTIFVAGMIASSIGNEWLWDTSNYAAAKDYLFGKQQLVTPKTGNAYHIGGILRPDAPPVGSYRLYIFLGSALLFAWFFITFGVGGQQAGGAKLSYAIAIIIAANLAHKGESVQVIIKVAEVLFFLILIKNIPADMVAGFTGGFAPVLRWGIAALLTAFIFCTIFNQSFIVGVISKPIQNYFDLSSYVGCGDTGPPGGTAAGPPRGAPIAPAAPGAVSRVIDAWKALGDIPWAAWFTGAAVLAAIPLLLPASVITMTPALVIAGGITLLSVLVRYIPSLIK